MWWIILFTTLTTALTIEQKDKAIEDLKKMLHDEATNVVRQHTDEMFRPPKFDMPADFMRSFVPNTGVGNREELVIDSIKEVPVFYDANFTQWHYKRFNNTNYILSASDILVVLHKLNSEENNFLVFAKDESLFTFTPEYKSVVTDTVMFTRTVKGSMYLYVAILTESAKSSLVQVFEIARNKDFMIGLINLNSNRLFEAKKISYVQAQYGGYLVILISTSDVSEVIYKQEGSSESNHYIEIHYPSAIDMITYTIHGHGYIAVTNITTCEIFKLDQFARSHLLFDRISLRLKDIADLEHFRLGFHHYLAVVGKEEQHLYIWKSGEYSWWQSFNEDNVKQIHAALAPSCRDDVLLYFIKEDSIDVYIYNGKNDVFNKSAVAMPQNFNASPGSVASFALKNKAVILFLTKNWNLVAFLIETSLQPSPNPVLLEGEKISKYMEIIQELLKEQTEQVQYIKDVIKNAVQKTGDQTITSFQSFDDLRSSEGAVIEQINSTIFVEWEGSDLTLDQYKKGTELLEKNVLELEKLVEEMEKIIPDIVRVDEEMEISGTKRFVGDITGSSVLALSVNLESVAGINLPKLQKEVYRLDKSQRIQGTLTFKNPLTITGNLDVGTINGIDISEDVMTTNTEQTSFAEMTFQNNMVVQGDLDIAGTFNGIKIRDEVLTLAGSHVIPGKKIFQSGIIAENVTAKIIDGVDIEDLYKNAVTKEGTQEIPGTKTFSGGLETRDIILHGHLNGYNISELAASIVRIDEPAEIFGEKTFLEDVTIHGPLTVGGKVNDLRIPEDLFLTDKPQEVTGYKEFTGTIIAEDVIVAEEIDGLRIPEDIVTLSGDEEIPGVLHFTDGITVDKDIVVEGLVDGVDISEVAKEALKLNESNKFDHAVFLGPVTITGNLDVKGAVNKVDLDEIVKDIVFKGEKNIIIESEKHFRKVVAEKVKVNKMLNGYNISVDFMKVHGDQVINGVKTFTHPVKFTTLNIGNGMIGDLNVTRLYENRLSLIIEDEIERDIEFSNDVIVEGNLIVHGTVGGLRIPEDIVLRNSSKVISNKVFTNHVKVDNLLVGGDAFVSGSFGGIDLTKFYNDRITLDGLHEIEGDLLIGDSVVGTMELSGGLNGIDIKEFANNVMSKTKNQTVIAAKEFSGITTVYGKITTENGVNGMDLADVNKRAFKLYENNIVTGDFEFQNITVQSMTVGGYINGVNLTYLADNSLKKKGLQYVTGETVFESGFHVEGDINADKVNDMVIFEDVLLKNTPQNITGQFTFGSLGITGDLKVDGFINGLDLSEIAPKLARIDEEAIVTSNVTFVGPIKVVNDIVVSGLVNGIDLSTLSDNVLFKEGNQEIKGNKILKGNVTIKGDLDIGLVNGVAWKEFLADVIRIDMPQTIKSAKTFIDNVEADAVRSSLTKADLINGESLEELIEDAVFVDIPANITGRKTFKNAVEISGNMTADLINGLQLKTDVITLMCSEDGPQVITGKKSFQKLVAYGDIEVGGTVNSYNLMELYKDTLLTEGEQVIDGSKVFSKEVVFKKNVYADSVNGLKLEDDLVTLNTEQDIEGPLVIDGDVYIEKDLIVHGLISDVNIAELADKAVYLNTNQTIDGSYFFHKASVTSDVAVSGTVNGIDLVAFDRNVTEFWDDVSHSLTAIEKHSEDHCEMLNYLQEVLSKSYYILDGFVLHQNLNHPASYLHVISPLDITFVALDDFQIATAVPNTWETSSKSFVPKGETFPTLIAKQIVELVNETEIVINIGIYDKDSHVLVNGRVTNIPGGFKEASIAVRKKEVIIALLFPSKGKSELYRLSELKTSVETETYGVVNVGKDATSIAIFDIKKTLYLAVSRKYASPYSKGFCKIFGQVNEGWQRIQSISVAASTIVKHFMYHGYHYLVFTNVAPVHETREPKSIQVYRNSGPKELYFTLFQKVIFDDAKGFEIFEFGDLSELYVTAWNETKIEVFRLEGESGLKKTFTLHGKFIKDVKASLIENDVYLIIGQQNLKTDEPVYSVVYKSLTKGSKFTPRNFTYC